MFDPNSCQVGLRIGDFCHVDKVGMRYMRVALLLGKEVHMSTLDSTYNYTTFRPGHYLEGACDGPSPGEPLGDYVIHDLDGHASRLEDLTEGVTVIETGSTTCPLYCAQIEPMREVARRHPGVRFVMLYTREAHPGERRGRHESIEDKIGEASRADESAGEWREVWVDGLNGELHKRLSGSPNSMTVLDADAAVIAWHRDSDARATGELLERLASGSDISDVRPKFRPPPLRALRALFRGGWKGVWDFMRGLPAVASYRLSGGSPC